MTAEVVILNKMAVALAADSKVTVGRDGQEKTFDSVNKLFTLSKYHPVGFMVYGNAEFMGFPWETIVKIYREKKGMSSEESIKAWSEDFLSFLSEFHAYTDEEKEYNIRSIVESHVFDIRDRVSDRFFLEEDVEIEDIAVEEIEKLMERASSRPLFLENPNCDDVTKKYKDIIDYSILNFLRGLEDERKDEISDKLRVLIKELLCKFIFSPLSSGIVFSGFGDDEKFPSVVSYDIDGFVGNNLKFYISSDHQIGQKSRCVIIPFAQHDMVHRFMEGIDPHYSEVLQESIRSILVSNAISVVEAYADNQLDLDQARAEVEKAANESYEKFFEEAVEWRQSRFSRPITMMVSSLPKDELANLAESLVNLTSLKRRVSRDLETVGGPVDVAVISKGDGFVWIKRKHYFPIDLNLHFKMNYFRQLGRENHE